MTLADLKSRYPTWNIRYVLYALSFGRTPDDMPRTGAANSYFIIWSGKMLRKYRNLPDVKGAAEERLLINYEEWLFQRVREIRGDK